AILLVIINLSQLGWILYLKFVRKEKNISIEDDRDFEITTDMKAVLDERMQEEENTYLSSQDSIHQLNKKYGV
ncbi:MAG: hypothetical protein K2Q03_02900, partial [Sphingobacteriaceae bacterium]|nr:hypothetical protein [Sphingobacteriaceae bacterium]